MPQSRLSSPSHRKNGDSLLMARQVQTDKRGNRFAEHFLCLWLEVHAIATDQVLHFGRVSGFDSAECKSLIGTSSSRMTFFAIALY